MKGSNNNTIYECIKCLSFISTYSYSKTDCYAKNTPKYLILIFIN